MVARKHPVLRRGEEPDLERILVDGRAFEYDAHNRRLAVPTEDELRVAWQEHGARLVRECIQDSPGTRPWGWWQFACPIAPWFSWPLVASGRVGGVRSRDRYRPSDQDQHEHLARHGLLTAGEEDPDDA